MKNAYKSRLCLLLALCMAALFLPQSLAKEQPGTPTDLSEQAPPDAAASLQQDLPVASAYDKAEYSENDVNVINTIIDNNGLKAQKDDPENWGSFARWNTESPKRMIRLNLSDKTLTGSLKVSGLTALTELNCYSNQLTELDVSGLDVLTYLDCSGNEMTSLKVDGLPALTYLYCENNNFTSLDLTGLPKNIRVICSLNQLTDPDGKMITVGPAENGFAQIIKYGRNKDGVAAVGQVGIQAYPQRGYTLEAWNTGSTDNPLSFTLTQSESIIPSFIAETDPRFHREDLDFLEQLIVDQELDGKVGIHLGYPDTYTYLADWQDDGTAPTNKRLIDLYLSYLGLTGSLEVSGLTALTDLRCYNNQLTSLNVSGLPALTYLDCPGNQLTSLKVDGLPALTTLYCSNNQLTGLELNGLPALIGLYCFDNQLSSLELSGLPAFISLGCSNNQLTELNVSGLSVKYLYCEGNPLSSLVLAGGKSIAISVTGSGRPWLESFSYQSGEPSGTYTTKPAAGYGGAWSNPTGCTIENDGSLTYDMRANAVSTVSAGLTFTRTEPLTADPNTVELTGEGVQPGGQVQKGSTFTFTANPIETGAAEPYNGDVRYMPESWSVNPSGNFDSGYTQTFSTADMVLGNHTLTVTYRMQKYNGAEWELVNETIEKTLSFTLVAQDTPGGGDTPGGNTPGGGQNGANGVNGTNSANPGTGDSGYAWYIIGLALAGGAMLLMARKKKTA